MEFVKVEGLGNDFILIPSDVEPSAEEIQRWCHRRTGVGADGVLTAVASEDGRVRMRYWNADGGEAEMCGNGLRCVARFAFERGWVLGPSFVIDSAVGVHPVTVSPDSVRAFVGSPLRSRTDVLNVAGEEIFPVSIGNPHAVVFVDDIDSAAVAETGPAIENDAIFPNRTNVEFVEVTDVDRIALRVWERGVGETRASGTGAAAAVFVARDRGLVGEVVAVELSGGELTIELGEDGAWMVGPAEVVFRGDL